MEEELKKLKKELLKTQKDLEEVKKANKDKDRYYNEIIKTKNSGIAEKDKIMELMALDIYGIPKECNRYFKDVEEVKQHFKKLVESKQDFE